MSITIFVFIFIVTCSYSLFNFFSKFVTCGTILQMHVHVPPLGIRRKVCILFTFVLGNSYLETVWLFQVLSLYPNCFPLWCMIFLITLSCVSWITQFSCLVCGKEYYSQSCKRTAKFFQWDISLAFLFAHTSVLTTVLPNIQGGLPDLSGSPCSSLFSGNLP